MAGRVFDESGAVIAGATVRVWRPGTAMEEVARTNAAGEYGFGGLIEGAYEVSAAATDFAAEERTLALAAGEELQMDFTLLVRPVAQKVVVAVSRLNEGPEELQRVPGSFDYIDQEALQVRRAYNFTEVLRQVAGVHVREDEGFGARPHIGIRGVSPTRSTKVLLLEDGIPLAYAPYGDNASYYHPPVDRYQGIEVLKGSGQILYGPVTVSGVVNYLTPNPPPKPAGGLTFIGGNRDYVNAHLNYGGTWGKTGLLFDVLRKQGQGPRDNVKSGLSDFNFKLVSGLRPQHAVTMRFNVYDEDSQVTYSGLREEEFAADPRQNLFVNDHFFGRRYGLSGTHTYVINPQWLLTTNVYGSLFQRDWWRQSSNSNQRPNDASDPTCGGMVNLTTSCGNEGRLREYYHWGIEPRLHANTSFSGVRSETDFGFRWHYENQDRRQENGERPTSRTGRIVEDNERKNDAYSAFLANRFVLLGKLAVTPGLRMEHVRYKRTNRLADNGLGVGGETSLTEWIPGVGVSYSFTERTSVFLGVHRGFAPPRTEDIIDNTTGGVVDLEPERSWNYEVGLRTVPRSGLRLDATFFRMDYENQVVPASVAGGLGATLTNGGETLHQGFELTARLDSGPLLGTKHNLYGRLAYTFLGQARFTGERLSNIPGFSAVSVSGNRLPYAPKHLADLILGYSHPSGVDILFEWAQVSDQFGDDLNTGAPTPDGQRGLIPSYNVWNASFNYHLERVRSTFFVAVKNLADRLYIVDRTRGILPGSPRLVQVGLKYSF